MPVTGAAPAAATSTPATRPAPRPPLPFARSSRGKSSHQASINRNGGLDIPRTMYAQYTSSEPPATTENSAHLLQPTRPAPPPPTSAGTPDQRSSMRGTHPHARPNCPPPPRPPAPQPPHYDEPVLNFERTRLAFVHQANNSERSCNTSQPTHSKVTALSKRFENS